MLPGFLNLSSDLKRNSVNLEFQRSIGRFQRAVVFEFITQITPSGVSCMLRRIARIQWQEADEA